MKVSPAANNIASLFDWVVAGPVTLSKFAEAFPIPFIISVVVSFLVALGFCSAIEGPKKIGYTLLGAYVLVILEWVAASYFFKL